MEPVDRFALIVPQILFTGGQLSTREDLNHGLPGYFFTTLTIEYFI